MTAELLTPEEIVIGMALNDPRDLSRALEAGLTAEHFANPVNQRIFAALATAEAKGRPTSLAAIGSEFPDLSLTLVRLAAEAPIGQNVLHYAEEVKSSNFSQIMAKALNEAAGAFSRRKAYEPLDDLKRATELRIINLIRGAVDADGPVPMNEVMGRVLGQIESIMVSKERRAIPTGLRVLDKAIGGWRPGMLYFPAARPGRGKTTFATNAMDVASAAGHWVCFFTIEMPVEQIGQKHLSLTARVRGTRMDRGDLSDEEVDRIHYAVEQLHSRRIWIDDSTRGSIAEICSRARRLKRQGKLDVVFVDYLQLLRAPGRWQSRQAELSEITGALKRLALELKIAIVCLSTINREAEKYGEPGLHHLKDSGSIEQDGDAVMIIHVDDQDRTTMNVAKNRHGPQCRFLITTDLAVNKISDGSGVDPSEVQNV